MNHIQKESEYNQYWFYVSTPEYKLCPNSSDCKDDIDNKSPCKKSLNLPSTFPKFPKNPQITANFFLIFSTIFFYLLYNKFHSYRAYEYNPHP